MKQVSVDDVKGQRGPHVADVCGSRGLPALTAPVPVAWPLAPLPPAGLHRLDITAAVATRAHFGAPATVMRQSLYAPFHVGGHHHYHSGSDVNASTHQRIPLSLSLSLKPA